METPNARGHGEHGLRAARKLTRRSGREKAGRFLAEGPQAVREAIRFAEVVEIFVVEGRHDDLVDAATTAGIPVHMASDSDLAKLSETITPQGVVAVCDSVAVDLETGVADNPRLVAVLADVRDPGNAGTVIRCADAAGADTVVLTRGSVDPQGGKAVRASVGSLFHLPTVTGVTTAETVTALHARDMTVLAADGSGDLDLDQAEGAGLLSKPTAWLFGNEAWGLPDDVRDLADHVVRIPIYGQAESLNLATAAALCLYASARSARTA